MQLGRTIIGAVIGAAIGIAVMVGLYLSPLNLQTVFLALLVAVLTGLGVRIMVATRGHASYLRGAITAAFALSAYLFGWYVVAGYAKQSAAKAAESTRSASMDSIGDKAADDGEAEKADEQKPPEPPKTPVTQPRTQPIAGAGKRPPMQTDASALEIVVLCISALIAYELGRGTAPKPGMVTGESSPPPDVPQGIHPDA